MRFLLLFLLMTSVSFADVKEDRIKALNEEGSKLMQEIQQLNTVINEKSQRVVEIRGALKELSIKEDIKK